MQCLCPQRDPGIQSRLNAVDDRLRDPDFHLHLGKVGHQQQGLTHVHCRTHFDLRCVLPRLGRGVNHQAAPFGFHDAVREISLAQDALFRQILLPLLVCFMPGRGYLQVAVERFQFHLLGEILQHLDFRLLGGDVHFGLGDPNLLLVEFQGTYVTSLSHHLHMVQHVLCRSQARLGDGEILSQRHQPRVVTALKIRRDGGFRVGQVRLGSFRERPGYVYPLHHFINAVFEIQRLQPDQYIPWFHLRAAVDNPQDWNVGTTDFAFDFYILGAFQNTLFGYRDEQVATRDDMCQSRPDSPRPREVRGFRGRLEPSGDHRDRQQTAFPPPACRGTHSRHCGAVAALGSFRRWQHVSRHVRPPDFPTVRTR